MKHPFKSVIKAQTTNAIFASIVEAVNGNSLEYARKNYQQLLSDREKIDFELWYCNKYHFAAKDNGTTAEKQYTLLISKLQPNEHPKN